MTYARKKRDDMGSYVDPSTDRWDVMFAVNPYNPASWQRFESAAAALAEWGLTYDPLPPLQGFGVASPLPDDALPEAEG